MSASTLPSAPSAHGQPAPTRVQSKLLAWFAAHKRDLPWRAEPRNPYHVWLSEAMLQQTQVATVIPYFRRWLERFPTLKDLAAAPLDDVLKLWEGLGYYARARNLHRAARVVMRDYNGQLPDTVDELLKLPGIGRYTAGAIASLAFGRDAPVLDGNVKRVLARLYALQDIHSREAVERLWRLSETLLPHGQAGPFNEALMELGATVCLPRGPLCLHCPLRAECRAFATGAPEAYPARSRRAAKPQRISVAAVVRDSLGRVLIAQRPLDGLLGGLWEFPGGEIESDEPADEASRASALVALLHRKTGLHVRVQADDFVGAVRHTFTHFTLTRYVASIQLDVAGPPLQPAEHYLALRWATGEEMSQLALTRSDHKIRALVLDRLRAGRLF